MPLLHLDFARPIVIIISMSKAITVSVSVGLQEFRAHAARYINAATKGRRFTVHRRAQPLFTIAPAAEAAYNLDEVDGKGWETLIDFTKIRKGGVPIEEVIASFKRTHGQD